MERNDMEMIKLYNMSKGDLFFGTNSEGVNESE